MLAITGGTEALVYIAAAVGGALIIGLAKAAMNWLSSKQTHRRNEDADQRNLAEYLFGIDKNPRTGAPAKEGWTSRVDRTLDALEKGQAKTTSLVNEILLELRPGADHSFRGLIEHNAQNAETEVHAQIAERKRVQKRDTQWNNQS